MISLTFKLSILHGYFVFLSLLVLDVLVTVVEDTHAPIQYDVELVAIVTLSEYEISLGKVFILHLAADLTQVLVIDLPLFKEVVLFDIGD